MIARQIRAWGEDGDWPRRSAGVFLELALLALAWLFLAHALIAWGNALGLLPVMGQPMTWLAAGNSHLLLFGLPTLVLGLAAGWLAREAPD